jgi:hypothetical protein
MLTIVCNPTGFHVINILGNGYRFNATHYITEGLSPLAEWRRNQVGRSDRKFIVHANTACLHTARNFLTFRDEIYMRKAPHLPYFPDLSPSDFFLFGHLKHLGGGAEFPDRDSLFDAIVHSLTALEKVSLNDMFLWRMDRIRSCTVAHGDHIE